MKFLSKSPQPFSYREIGEKFNFRSKIKNNYTYLHDLSCTLAINLKDISGIKSTELISRQQMDIIQNKISKISELFKNYRKFQKNEKNLRSKILVNKQLFQEINRRNREELLILQEKKLDIKKAIDKKEIIIRKFKKKFNEIEIFIRRESQAYENYKHFINFTMDSFIIKNTKILSMKKEKKDENDKVIELINIIKCQNKEFKNTILNNGLALEENNEKNLQTKIKSLNDFLAIKNDKNKYFSDYIEKLNKLSKKIGAKNLNIELEEYTNNLLINLGQLNLDNYSKLFKSDSKSSTLNYQENSNQDSSELWSASEIEK